METKVIALADVRPNEKNPRTDFGDLDALWESFSFNSENPGEPVNPIVVVQDGNVYRIVDGERRYRAMSSHGQQTCHAVVCSGYDDMAQAVQMLATDDKLSLTAQEQCVGIQQMLLLGVDEQRVADVSHAPVEAVHKVKNVVKWRGIGQPGTADIEYPVYQATLEQMIAVADVDETGDGDLADELLADRNWQKKYEDFCRDRRNREEYEACVSAAKDAGFKLIEGGWEDLDKSAYGPMRYAHGPGEFAELYEKGYRFAHIENSNWGPSCHVYLPLGEAPQKSEAELEAERNRAETEAAREQMEDALEKVRADIGKWYMERLNSGSAEKSVMAMEKLAREALFSGGRYDFRLTEFIDEFIELTGCVKHSIGPEQLTWELKAAAFPLIYPCSEAWYTLARALAKGLDAIDEWSIPRAIGSANDLCATVNQFVAAGYEAPDWVDDLMRKVEAITSWEKEANEDASDSGQAED